SATTEIASAAKTVEDSGLNLYYGSFLAVKDVDVTIEPNKVTALIGSSGCGKSTFLRSLNRMHELVAGARVEGEVALEGQDISADGVDPVVAWRRVGLVFQERHTCPAKMWYGADAAGLQP